MLKSDLNVTIFSPYMIFAIISFQTLWLYFFTLKPEFPWYIVFFPSLFYLGVMGIMMSIAFFTLLFGFVVLRTMKK